MMVTKICGYTFILIGAICLTAVMDGTAIASTGSTRSCHLETDTTKCTSHTCNAPNKYCVVDGESCSGCY